MIILPLAIREIFSSWQMLSPPFLAMAPNYFCNESGYENFQNLQDWQDFANVIDTGKSLSEALIFASTNQQNDDRLFIELQDQYLHENSKLKPGENMLCTEIVSDIQNNFCTQHVLPMF